MTIQKYPAGWSDRAQEVLHRHTQAHTHLRCGRWDPRTGMVPTKRDSKLNAAAPQTVREDMQTVGTGQRNTEGPKVSGGEKPTRCQMGKETRQGLLVETGTAKADLSVRKCPEHSMSP